MPELPRMLIEVGGGLVQRIVADGECRIQVHVVDHDEDNDCQCIDVDVIEVKEMDLLLRPEGMSALALECALVNLVPQRHEMMVSVDHWDENGNLVNDLYPVMSVVTGPLHTFGIINIDQREIAKVSLTGEEEH
jgi:hypothetical protein